MEMKIGEKVKDYFPRLVNTHQLNEELWRRNVRSSNNRENIVHLDISI
jgi:hypothetical protein